MDLKGCLEKIDKSDCPDDCTFKYKREIKIALVPPPDEILGVIISRDPTTRWYSTYTDIKKNYEEETVRTKLFETAIPNSLKNQIEFFMKESIDKNNLDCLFDTLFQKVYWTHLHKCFTDASGKQSLKFNIETANQCADKWLKEELFYAIGNKTKFLIVLGKEAQSWVKKWKDKEGKDQNIKVINLLHPSGQNNRIWRRSAIKEIEQTENAIREWIELCRRD